MGFGFSRWDLGFQDGARYEDLHSELCSSQMLRALLPTRSRMVHSSQNLSAPAAPADARLDPTLELTISDSSLNLRKGSSDVDLITTQPRADPDFRCVKQGGLGQHSQSLRAL